MSRDKERFLILFKKKAYATSTLADKETLELLEYIYKLQQHVHCFTNNNKKSNK